MEIPIQDPQRVQLSPRLTSPNLAPDISDHPMLRSWPLRSPALATITEDLEPHPVVGDPTTNGTKHGLSPQAPTHTDSDCLIPTSLQPAPITKDEISLMDRILELTKEIGKLNQLLEAKVEENYALKEQIAALQETLRCQIAVKNGTLRALSNALNRPWKRLPITSASRANTPPELDLDHKEDETHPRGLESHNFLSRWSSAEDLPQKKLMKMRSLPNFKLGSKLKLMRGRKKESEEPLVFDVTKRSWLNITPDKSCTC